MTNSESMNTQDKDDKGGKHQPYTYIWWDLLHKQIRCMGVNKSFVKRVNYETYTEYLSIRPRWRSCDVIGDYDVRFHMTEHRREQLSSCEEISIAGNGSCFRSWDINTRCAGYIGMLLFHNAAISTVRLQLLCLPDMRQKMHYLSLIQYSCG